MTTHTHRLIFVSNVETDLSPALFATRNCFACVLKLVTNTYLVFALVVVVVVVVLEIAAIVRLYFPVILFSIFHDFYVHPLKDNDHPFYNTIPPCPARHYFQPDKNQHQRSI
ncbi:unnamed protein product [Amoebophrya sp. A25]|nr:unnamed protein product [Amoebophrya sp. A25]|eukprot:GSA25T00022677001.1